MPSHTPWPTHTPRSFGLDRELITVIPRGRVRERLGEAEPATRVRVRRALGLDEHAPVILTVGRQEAQKGHRFLLEAAPAIVSAHPDVCILVAGRPGGMTDMLQRRLDELRLGIDSSSSAFETTSRTCSQSTDLFAFHLLCEGLGGAVLEAMALNVPTIASEVSALREVLDGGRCGALVPPADADALAEACIDLLSSRPRAASLASVARARFDSEYSVEVVTRAMMQLYRRLVAR